MLKRMSNSIQIEGLPRMKLNDSFLNNYYDFELILFLLSYTYKYKDITAPKQRQKIIEERF